MLSKSACREGVLQLLPKYKEQGSGLFLLLFPLIIFTALGMILFRLIIEQYVARSMHKFNGKNPWSEIIVSQLWGNFFHYANLKSNFQVWNVVIITKNILFDLKLNFSMKITNSSFLLRRKMRKVVKINRNVMLSISVTMIRMAVTKILFKLD